MANFRVKIPKILSWINESIEKVKSVTEISEAVKKFGYDKKRIAVGEAYYKKTKQLAFEKNTISKKLTKFSDKLDLSSSKAFETYRVHHKVAKIILNEKPHLSNKIGCLRSPKNGVIKWLAETRGFYAWALDEQELVKGFLDYKIYNRDLDAGLALVDDVEKCRLERLNVEAELKLATKARNKALTQAQKWCNDMISIARLELKDKSLLPKLVR